MKEKAPTASTHTTVWHSEGHVGRAQNMHGRPKQHADDYRMMTVINMFVYE